VGQRVFVVRILLAVALVGALPGCANLDTSNSFVARWSMRSAGALASFALHEACHLALGAALGADVDASFRGSSLYLEFGNLSSNEDQAVAIMGNMCTGIVAELIVDTGKHRKSNLAWGAAAFHAINTFGYAWSPGGDAEYWESSGGSRASWQAINASHSAQIGARLAWDSDFGEYLKRRWRIGPPLDPDLVLGFSEAVNAAAPELNLLSEPNDTESELVLHVFDSFPSVESIDAWTD
jgi:hypothetical protein